MQHLQTIRIGALLAVIFAGGVVTGRMTAPQPIPVVISAPGRTLSTDWIMTHLTQQVGLDKQQQTTLRPIIDDLIREMEKFPPATQERLNLYLAAVPRMRQCLREDQYAAFNRNVRQTEQAFQRNIRKRTAH